EGGVADPKSIPSALLEEMYLVGNREDTTTLSSASAETGDAGKMLPKTTAASMFTYCLLGGTDIRPGRPNGTPKPISYPASRWLRSSAVGTSWRWPGRES